MHNGLAFGGGLGTSPIPVPESSVIPGNRRLSGCAPCCGRLGAISLYKRPPAPSRPRGRLASHARGRWFEPSRAHC